jgi:putative transcriptional regulator
LAIAVASVPWSDEGIEVDASLAGRLLVATPALEDPNFERTVILLLQHDDEDGAMGLVLNRPSGLPLEEELDDWGELAAPPAEVFIGGPVQPEVAIALGWLEDADLVPAGVQSVSPGLGVVDLRRAPSEMPGLAAVRVFAGYAGWSPGQLEMEIEEGAWFTLAADLSDPATPDPDGLWREVFRRQPDDGFRLLATYPDDPSAN